MVDSGRNVGDVRGHPRYTGLVNNTLGTFLYNTPLLSSAKEIAYENCGRSPVM